jgi:hypothetical protein
MRLDKKKHEQQQTHDVDKGAYSGATIWPALRGAQGEIQGGGAGALAG